MASDIPITEELLHALPKTDLHCHLDGSLRLKTMLELAEQQGVKLPADSEAGLARAMKIGQRHGSLEEYLKGFEITLSVMQTEDALYRTAYELALDAAEEKGELDIMRDLATPLPVLVIAQMMGVPAEERHHVRHLAEKLLYIGRGEGDRMQPLTEGMRGMIEYVSPLVDRRIVDPGDDFISVLATGEKKGVFTRREAKNQNRR